MNQNNTPQPEERVRAQQCLDLRIQGATYQQIADRLGYADRSGARRAIERLLDRTEFETVDEYRALESDRLDALHRAHWPAAMLGDVDATKLIVKISERRCRLLGLDRPTRVALEGLPQGENFAETAVQLMSEILEAGEAEAAEALTRDTEEWVRG